MRKLVAILLLFFYLIPAIGLSIDAHWCGKKVKIVSIDSSHEKKCPCSKKMSNGCCSDVHVSLKLTDSQKIATQVNFPSNSFVKLIAATLPCLISLSPRNNFVFNFSTYHAPPFKSKEPVFLLNSVIRI